MDSITHIALGAVAGEALAGKSLGKRALFYGAIAQSIPDVDFVAAFFLSPTGNLLAHRGITHSFLFGMLVTIAVSLISARIHRPLKIPLYRWTMLWGVEILLHLLLDACNAYGVGWLEPFSDRRFSFHLLFVADPFFSVAPCAAMFALIYLDSKNPIRFFWMYFGLIAAGMYFLYAVYNKISIERTVRDAVAREGIHCQRVMTTPTPLNTWLWYAVVESDSGFYTSYKSVLDSDRDVGFRYVPQRGDLLRALESRDDVQDLLAFSQGYYVVEQRADTLVFNDLRFGEIAGWADPDAAFVFHYYLTQPDANLMVIQRGRFSNWNRTTFYSLLERIRGD